MSQTIEERNRALMIEAVAAMAHLLGGDQGDEEDGAALAHWERFEAAARTETDLPIGQLADRCELSSFELKVLVMALSCHTDTRMAALVADVGRELFSHHATVRVALEHFCSSPNEKITARKAFLASGALLQNQLIVLTASEAGAAPGLLSRPFELTTPTLSFLLVEMELTEGIARLATLEMPDVDLLNVVLDPQIINQVRELVENHHHYRELISAWGFDRVLPYGRGITMLFSGPSGTGKTLLAQALAHSIARPLLTLNAADLPDSGGIEATLRDLFAEAAMRDAIVLVDECDVLLGKGDRRKATAFRAIESFEGILVLVTNHPDKLDEAVERRIIYHVPFEPPDASLRRQIWEVHLPPEVPLEGDIDLTVLANLYDFSGGTIKNAILFAVNRALAIDPDRPVITMALLEEGCRSQLRYALEALTVRHRTHLRLGDIVLPEDPSRKVGEIIAACRNQAVVLNRWGFGKRLVTGKGITVLFDGPPGTGKTLCAEIIAGELDRTLYRVNIPEIVSKWVGETEKNIREIFQQARISHAMLLFDEADSLFGARVTETRSSNDRAANMEVNLLLQEIERFPGICILTTNFFGSLDRALVRRIQFRVTFEEPDLGQRAKIWQTLCPPEAPVDDDVDFDQLARHFEMTGAMIKNSLLRAAYAACEIDSKMTHAILASACRDEFAAAGKVARVLAAKPTTA